MPLIWRYPTDVSLLNEAREKTAAIIDQLHVPLVGKTSRPRTYRKKARRCFVAFTKHKKPGRKKVRRAKRQQLGFLRRNFKAIDRLLENSAALPLGELARRDYKNLLVARELFRQQLEMFENKSQRVDDRIVSISQPHVRPIVRGKAGRPTEFGAKLSISVVQGFRLRKVWPSQAAIWVGSDHGQASQHVSGTDFAQFSGDELGAGSAAFLFIAHFTVPCLEQDGFRQTLRQLTRIPASAVALPTRDRMGRSPVNSGSR